MSQKQFQRPLLALCVYLADKGGLFSKVVIGFQNFVYDFWRVGGDVWRWLYRHVCRKISAHIDGGLSGGSSVRRPGSNDPHRRQRNFVFPSDIALIKTKLAYSRGYFMLTYTTYDLNAHPMKHSWIREIWDIFTYACTFWNILVNWVKVVSAFMLASSEKYLELKCFWKKEKQAGAELCQAQVKLELA